MLSSKRSEGRSVIDRFRTSGSLKALFPRAPDLSAIMINTSGGLTGGDRLDITASAGSGSQMTLTTQAAERAYRSASGLAEMHSHLRVEEGARLNWLPQELILFDGCGLNRSLDVSLAPDASVLVVEPVIFGRTAMGEVLSHGIFRDRITISREGVPLYHDALHLSGDIAAQLTHPVITKGMGAMCSLTFVSAMAGAHLDPLRDMMPATGGVSLLAPDVLTMRLVATDGFALRQTLLPVLDRLTDDSLPISWRL